MVATSELQVENSAGSGVDRIRKIVDRLKTHGRSRPSSRSPMRSEAAAPAPIWRYLEHHQGDRSTVAEGHWAAR